MSDASATPAVQSDRALLMALLRLLLPHTRKLLLALLMLFVSAGAMVGCPLLLRHAIDVDIVGRDLGGLVATCAAYLGLQGVLLVSQMVQQVMLERTSQQAVGDLRERLFAHLLRLPVSFHDEHPPGELLSRVESDVGQLRMMLSTVAVVFIGNAVIFAILFGCMLLIDVVLTAIVALVLPLLLTSVWLFRRTSTPLFSELREVTSRLTGALAEAIGGAATVQALRQEASTAAAVDALNRERWDTRVYVERRVVPFWNGVFLIEALGAAAVWWIGGMRVIDGVTTIGTLVLFTAMLQRLFAPIHQLAHQVQSVQQAFAGARTVFGLLDLEPETGAQLGAAPRQLATEGRQQAQQAASAGTPAVQLEQVCFAYEPDNWVLQDISLSIPAGERWGLVGVTGGGKSTLVNLLLRFYLATSGSVRLFGRDLAELAPEQARAQVGYVPQRLYLFPGTIEQNLTLGGVSPEAARQAAARVGIEPLIERLPGGWQCQVGERGARLSAGERQLISAARALVDDPPLLVLDEATSAVDPASEARLQAALAELVRGRTSLVVAHRLATIADADRILLLDKGRLIEQGSHAELLALGGRYAQLAELQGLGS